MEDGVLPALTVLRAKGCVTVLEMDYPIIEICIMNFSPFVSVPQHPYAVGVLLKEDFLVVDLTAPGYLFFFFNKVFKFKCLFKLQYYFFKSNLICYV